MGGLQSVPGADDAVRAALHKSHLGALPPQLLATLLGDATRLRIPAGGLLRGAGEPGSHLELVVGGLLRIFVTAPDGRMLTVRYGRSGDLVGLVSLFRDRYVMPGSIQAVAESEVLSLRPAVVRRLADSNLDVARVIIAELSERVVAFVAEIPDNVFASVRQRLVRHLLDPAGARRHHRDRARGRGADPARPARRGPCGDGSRGDHDPRPGAAVRGAGGTRGAGRPLTSGVVRGAASPGVTWVPPRRDPGR